MSPMMVSSEPFDEFLAHSTRLEYTPCVMAMSSLWVPCSIIAPSWITAMLSAFHIVESRWATIIEVHP